MPKPDTLSINVRVSGSLKTHVEATTTSGDFESVSEYVRDLIRRDKAQQEERAFTLVKAQLAAAFEVPHSDYRTLTTDELMTIARAGAA